MESSVIIAIVLTSGCELGDDDIARICDTFLAFEETEESKIFDNAESDLRRTMQGGTSEPGVSGQRVTCHRAEAFGVSTRFVCHPEARLERVGVSH